MWRNPAVVERDYIADTPVDLGQVITGLPFGARLGAIPAGQAKAVQAGWEALGARLTRGPDGRLAVGPAPQIGPNWR